jgi:hypothetical protein
LRWPGRKDAQDSPSRGVVTPANEAALEDACMPNPPTIPPGPEIPAPRPATPTPSPQPAPPGTPPTEVPPPDQPQPLQPPAHDPVPPAPRDTA